MRWILLDVALAVLALVLLGLVARTLWRRVKALGRELSRASELVAGASAALQAPPAGASGPGSRPLGVQQTHI